jgi:HEAT repeat protein
VELLERWTERWIAAVFLQGPAPGSPLSREALDAGLELRDLLKGDEGEALGSLLEQVGVARGLIRQLSSRRLAPRLEALDGLAKGRFQEAYHPLLKLLDDDEGVIRLMAGRALARILSDWAIGPERTRAMSEFIDAMRTAALPAGAAAEVLLLLEDAARPVLTALLTPTSDRPRILRAALDTTGRLGLARLKGKVSASITHPDPEVRAAALRALSRLGVFPRRMAGDLVRALDDRIEFVRVQAARAAVGLPQKLVVPVLYEHMGDRSWWVRRASAESLLCLGTGGRAALRRAAESHPDRFARDMSAQVLADATEIQAREPMQLEMTA